MPRILRRARRSNSKLPWRPSATACPRWSSRHRSSIRREKLRRRRTDDDTKGTKDTKDTKMLTVALLVLLLAVGQETPKPAAARADDVKSIDAIVAAVYDVISGPAGQKRDWDRMRSLFVPGARLIPAIAKPGGGAEARVLDVDGYIQRSGAVLERDGFFERQIAHRTETFGNIAHVFSTYESRRTAGDPAPFAR